MTQAQKRLPGFGSLEDYPLPGLFNTLCIQAKTGLLVLNSGEQAKLVSMSKGAPAAVQSTVPTDTLGHYLKETGLVSQDLFTKADEIVKKTGRDEGNVFVELGALNPNTLFEAMRANLRRQLLGCFAWKTGEFVLEELADLLPETVPIKLATPRLIIDGILTHYSAGQMGDLLTLPKSATARPREDSPHSMDSLGLSGEELNIYKLASSGKTVVDICAKSQSKKQVFGLLFALQCMNVISFSS